MEILYKSSSPRGHKKLNKDYYKYCEAEGSKLIFR